MFLLLQLTDELQQSFDRRGNRLGPIRSALDLHREKFALRLEKSSADRTRKQEEAWARIDECPSPSPSIAKPRKRYYSILLLLLTILNCCLALYYIYMMRFIIRGPPEGKKKGSTIVVMGLKCKLKKNFYIKG